MSENTAPTNQDTMYDTSADARTGLQLIDLIDYSPIGIVRLDEQGFIIELNHAFRELVKNKLPAPPTKFLELLEAADQPKFAEALEDVFRGTPRKDPLSLTLNIPDYDDIIISAYVTLIPPSELGAKPVPILHIYDQTEQKNLEMRFAHSQKMQAIGQLAGGVAHDFNNLLTAMIGFCDLLLMRHPAGDPSFADIMQVKQNANRAANLVRQLLAFSRRQTLQPKVLDLTDVLAELSNLIRRLIGENIGLDMQYGRDIGKVKADQGQLEQVIINLAVNARDAMKDGGSLTIRTSDVHVDAANPVPAHLHSPTDEEVIEDGDYVLLEVQDSGTGIPEDILENIFEPFFSTKEIGSGTGLGLATVYGIIKQTGGYVYVETEVDQGTTFHVYLKSYQPEESKEGADMHDDARATDLTGKATIMLVEDETPVRIFAARALRNKGYEVLEADSGESAISVFENHAGNIEVIISDVMMPGMNGPKMMEHLLETYPDRLKDTEVIFISGYAEDAFVDSYGTEREFNFLPKPFTLKQLASKVKEVTNSQEASE